MLEGIVKRDAQLLEVRSSQEGVEIRGQVTLVDSKNGDSAISGQ
jgi:hypothetical protein